MQNNNLISQYLNVSVPNVSDALDRLGLIGSTENILPIYPCSKIAGPAATLKYVPHGVSEESTVLGTLKAIVHGGQAQFWLLMPLTILWLTP